MLYQGIDPVDLRLLCFYAILYHSTEQKTGINIYINKKRLVDLLFYKQFLAEQRLESKATESLDFSFSTPRNLLSKVNTRGVKSKYAGVKIRYIKIKIFCRTVSKVNRIHGYKKITGECEYLPWHSVRLFTFSIIQL